MTLNYLRPGFYRKGRVRTNPEEVKLRVCVCNAGNVNSTVGTNELPLEGTSPPKRRKQEAVVIAYEREPSTEALSEGTPLTVWP
jgi:hypothetical protein